MPKVLYLANIAVQLTVTVAFGALQQINQIDNPPLSIRTLTDDLEYFILVYFISCVLREYLQLMVSSTVIEYVADIWNLIDVCSIVFFLLGMYIRKLAVTEGAGSEPELTHAELVRDDQVTTSWKFYYGVSLFFLLLRALRVLAIFQRLGLLVLVIIRMGQDVINFLVVFALFTLSFAVLLFDAGTSKPYLEQDSCADGEAGFASCLGIWWLLRTFLQGFGELYLEEMENSIVFVMAIAAFLMLNVMLLNLLIAVMSGTYEEVSGQAGR